MKTLLYIILFVVPLSGAFTHAAEVDLSWKDNSANETGFEIERRLSEVAVWTKIGEVGKDVVKFTDVHADLGKTYVYRVCAYNEYGRSGYTPSVTHQMGSPPAAPTDPKTEGKGDYVPRPVVQLGLININTSNGGN